jgi:hypothetical protein
LLGWGVDNPAGFFANPVRMGFAVITLVNTLFLGWLAYHIPPQHHQEHDLEYWHYSVSELVFILGAFGDQRNMPTWDENPTPRWAGLGIYLLALLYFFWASLT